MTNTNYKDGHDTVPTANSPSSIGELLYQHLLNFLGDTFATLILCGVSIIAVPIIIINVVGDLAGHQPD